ncbi:folliculin-interacting protein 1-like isoform X2 [Mya arenaria]|uniref:folliculin-interacting protein 1-like isoform X2 n=1 Tax=Mya arenaria TaxID=6604 RepID=UPI0022E6F41B|nr:folliculin-interacting protein 1-like isoform X2 [Mya arenaria]
MVYSLSRLEEFKEKLASQLSCYSKSGKKPQFDGKSLRIVLFVDSDVKGRRLIFDSKAVVKEDDKGCKRGKCNVNQKLRTVSEDRVQNAVSRQKNYSYQPQKTGSDSKKLEEIMFGAVGVAYKGSSFKVHITSSPSQLMLTKVFIPEKPKRLSTADSEDCSFSSITDISITAPRAISQGSDANSGIAQSIPVDVPSLSPRQSWMRSIDLLDEDSGLASLTSSGSFQGSFSGSQNSYQARRITRGQSTSLDGHGRRGSHHDVFPELSAKTPKRVKIAIGCIFDTQEDRNEPASRLFESFFFSHIALLESHLEQLRREVERVYYTGQKQIFYPVVIEAYENFKRDMCDLYTAQRLTEPIWLTMMSYTSYRYMLCDRFLKEFVGLVKTFETKNSNFFMSSLLTAVLTHHLAWVPTVMPAGGTPTGTYLGKHSAKWVDTLAKSHPYNPLWAQLGDLYGAIGFPLKLSRTVVVGKKADIVKKFLFILSYFIRCSDILETSDVGCLDTYLDKLDFDVESPMDSAKTLPATTPTNVDFRTVNIGSPTPVNEDKGFNFDSCGSCHPSIKSFQSLPLDSLLSVNEKESSPGTDYNSNHGSVVMNQTCEACNANRTGGSKVGNSVFYLPSVSCICDKVAGANSESNNMKDSDNRAMIQKKKENLRLVLPESISTESQNNTENKECKLSMAEHLDSPKREKVGVSRRSAQPQELERTHISGYDIKLPENVEKVLTKKEIQSVFLQNKSDSMFNEYFDDETIEAKTIDELDEKDLVVDLPTSKNHLKSRYHSGDSAVAKFDEDQCKTPSLPDLTAVKPSPTTGVDGPHRARLGSMGAENPYKFRRSSISRQISEASTKTVKNVQGKTRPLTPAEVKHRHISSNSSYDLDLLDPRAYCHELPMPNPGVETSNCSSQKQFDKNFGWSLLADFSNHYMSDFVLQGTSDKHYQDKLNRDIRMAMQYSVLDEPIAEAVVVVADTDACTVRVFSSQHIDRPEKYPQSCMSSTLVSNLIDSLVSMARLKMSPEFCMSHLEDRLQEIYFKSKMMAEYLKKNKNVKELLKIVEFDRSDLPLLAAITGTHTTNFPLVCLS